MNPYEDKPRPTIDCQWCGEVHPPTSHLLPMEGCPPNDDACAVEGCVTPAGISGLCDGHWTSDDEDRFGATCDRCGAEHSALERENELLLCDTCETEPRCTVPGCLGEPLGSDYRNGHLCAPCADEAAYEWEMDHR